MADMEAFYDEKKITNDTNDAMEFVLDEMISICEDETMRSLCGKYHAQMLEQICYYSESAQNNNIQLCIQKLSLFEDNLQALLRDLHRELQELKNAYGDTDQTVVLGNYFSDSWSDSWANGMHSNCETRYRLSDYVNLVTKIRRISDAAIGCKDKLKILQTEELETAKLNLCTEKIYIKTAKLQEIIKIIDSQINKQYLFYDIHGNCKYQLNKKSILIGRDKETADFLIDNQKISRKHAMITYDSGNLYIEDLNSSNGTFVNESRIPQNERMLIKPNDKITFAHVDTLIVKESSFG